MIIDTARYDTKIFSCVLILFICSLVSVTANRDFLIPIVKPTRCINVSNLLILEWHCTRFGRSMRLSSSVQDCTYNKRHMSNRYCCLLVSKQTTVSVWQLYVQSWTADDGRKDRPKHVDCHSNINKFDKLVHLIVFTIGIILRCTAL